MAQHHHHGDDDSDLCHALTGIVGRRANELLKRDRDSSIRGWRRYTEWEQQKWKQQHYEYYEDDMFRCCYAISKLPWSVGISNKALDALVSADAGCAEQLLTGGLAVCVGCGPGSDAIALLGRRHSQNPGAPLAMFLIDRCSGWRSLLTSIDEHLRESRLPYSLWFKSGCVKDADGARRLLPDADLVVFSFAHSVNADPDLWSHLADRYKLVLVIDIASETLADTLQRAGFTGCHIESQSAVSVFYHVAREATPLVEDAAAEATEQPAVEDAAAAIEQPSVEDAAAATEQPSLEDAAAANKQPSVEDAVAVEQPSVEDVAAATERLSVIDAVT